MSQAAHIEMRIGTWAEQNPATCPCHGSGWLLANWDVWYQCPVHGKDVPHPDEEEVDFDYNQHRYKMNVQAYRSFRNTWVTVTGGTCPEFDALVRKELSDQPTQREWVNEAEATMLEVLQERAETQARANGYSCALEESWDMEAQREREEHGWR